MFPHLSSCPVAISILNRSLNICLLCHLVEYSSTLPKASCQRLYRKQQWFMIYDKNQCCDPLLQKFVQHQNSKRTALKLLISLSVQINFSGNMFLDTSCDIMWENPLEKSATHPKNLLNISSLPTKTPLSKGQYCWVWITPMDISAVHSLMKSKINFLKEAMKIFPTGRVKSFLFCSFFFKPLNSITHPPPLNIF